MKKQLILLLTISLLFMMCGQKDPVQVTPDPISGIWSESFFWSYFGLIIEPTYEIVDQEINRTTTLSFHDNSFYITVLPPFRTIVQTPDSVYTTWSNDTLFIGTYSLSDDVLLLHRDNSERIDRFLFTRDDERLHLSVAAEIDSGGIIMLPMSSFIWGYSFSKTSGDFIRIGN